MNLLLQIQFWNSEKHKFLCNRIINQGPMSEEGFILETQTLAK